MMNTKIIRVAAATPHIRVANTEHNEVRIGEMISEAEDKNCAFILLPELALTGCTAGDLFRQQVLYDAQLASLRRIVLQTRDLKITVILGFYLLLDGKHYNCSAVIQAGKIRGIVPKQFVTNDSESNDARRFSPAFDLPRGKTSLSLFDDEIPVGNLVFKDEDCGLIFGVEVGEVLTDSCLPSSTLTRNGALVIFNPTAAVAVAGRAASRRSLISAASKSLLCGYVSTSAGVSESTTDAVFSGQQLIAANGTILAESSRLLRGNILTVADIDCGTLAALRAESGDTSDSPAFYPFRAEPIEAAPAPLHDLDIKHDSLDESHAKNPFLPACKELADERCREIFDIQIHALAKRLAHIGIKKTIVGVSGGLDSTLALLVMSEAHKLLDLPPNNIIAVTLPGFGTTGKTYKNAVDMIGLLKADFREISIAEAVRQHFADIGHDESTLDLTYENAQARERTQILMDLAGKEGALLVGTGDLSELALGWCTYNGDHMSMYAVNTGLTKTLLMAVIRWIADSRLSGADEDMAFSSNNAALREILHSILDTPISPELLPPGENDSIIQKTEDSVGPYVLHDFFIYHTLRTGMPPQTLFFLAAEVFEDDYTQEFLLKCLKVFYKRFFSQQFKRSCMPDGPRVTEISLSPRGALAMPSDADAGIWMKEIERLEESI